jgi:hypothetical protein
MYGSEFTTEAAIPHGDSKKILSSFCVAGINPVVARARVYRETPFKSMASSLFSSPYFTSSL